MKTSLHTLQQSITHCERCPRLRAHCTQVALEKRLAYRDWIYWGRPIPNFLPAEPRTTRLLLLGLAPAAHGANRTGRMFTGDRSGDFLFAALHATGFANQPNCTSREDGLQLIDCAITAVCHCAPPDNKPTLKEITQCRPFLDQTLQLLPALRGIVALGKIAWDAGIREYRQRGWSTTERPPAFTHGALFQPVGVPFLLATYHPSQQNTFTGVLTQPMLQVVFAQAKKLINASPR